MARAFAEIAFTPEVRKIQAERGSAQSYAKLLHPEAERGNRLNDRETEFIRARDGFYQATVSETGWPYVQFRGGPKGFLHVLDDKTIGYADFRGNKQYISTGNLMTNNRTALILMDYAHRQRLKIWGRTTVINRGEDFHLLSRLHDPDYAAEAERAVIITVEAFDWNCPQHIPQRLTPEELKAHLEPLTCELEALRRENAMLRAKSSKQSVIKPE